jgi:hypothetical protein
VLTKPDLTRQESVRFQTSKKTAAARSTGLRPIHFSNRVETGAILSFFMVVIITKM